MSDKLVNSLAWPNTGREARSHLTTKRNTLGKIVKVDMVRAQISAFNDDFVASLDTADITGPMLSAVNFTRRRLRERSFMEQILPPTDVTNGQPDY